MSSFGAFELSSGADDVPQEFDEYGSTADGVASEIDSINFVMTPPEDDCSDPVVQLALEPIGMRSLTRYGSRKSGAEKTMTEMAWHMRRSLAETIAEDPTGFDPLVATDRACSAVLEHRGSVVSSVMQTERDRRYDSNTLTAVVMGGVGEAALNRETRVIPGDDFMHSLLADVEGEQDTLGSVSELLSSYEGTEILELVRSVHAATTREGGADIDEAYRLVADACRRPRELVLPEDRAGALYLMAFMPHDVRKLVRPLVIAEAVLSATREAISPASEEDASMFEAMEAFMLAECTSGYDWADVVKRDGCSEETSRQIALSGAAAFDAIKVIEGFAAESKGQRTVDAWYAAAHRLDAAVNATADAFPGLEFWQIVDNGHCFEGFIDLTLAYKIEDAREFNIRPSEKSGLRAVVLEDDPQQQTVWRSVVDRHTQYAPSDETTCSTADEVLAHLEGTDVGLYLLDIEDPAGAPTGVGVAQQVIARHLQALRDGEQPTPTTVVVWSSSGQAVKAASDELLPILQDTADIEGMVGWSTSGTQRLWPSNSLRVIISPKNWYALDHI